MLVSNAERRAKFSASETEPQNKTIDEFVLTC